MRSRTRVKMAERAVGPTSTADVSRLGQPIEAVIDRMPSLCWIMDHVELAVPLVPSQSLAQSNARIAAPMFEPTRASRGFKSETDRILAMRPNVYSKADAVGRQYAANDGTTVLFSRAKCSAMNPSNVDAKSASKVGSSCGHAEIATETVDAGPLQRGSVRLAKRPALLVSAASKLNEAKIAQPHDPRKLERAPQPEDDSTLDWAPWPCPLRQPRRQSHKETPIRNCEKEAMKRRIQGAETGSTLNTGCDI